MAPFPDLSAVRLTRELRERGYRGAYTAVKRFVAAIRPESQPKPFEVRFETPPGHQAQVDFARFVTTFTDEPGSVRIVWLFSMVLGHSRHIFARFVMHQDLQTLLRCHMLAFTALGGVPIEILYDRMKTAVMGEHADGHIIYNRSLIALGRHYGFLPRACRPYRAKTKGKVERPFSYIRQDFFLGRSFRNLDDLNGQLDDGLVSIGGNYYSVPDRTRRVVEVHQLPDQIRILDEGRLVATHPILEGRRQYRVDAVHRRGATARPVRHPADHQVIVGQIGDRVAHRSLAFYQAVGERLAVAGGRP